MKAEYVSGYEVSKRPTIYIDANDPRVRNPIEAKITAARLGAELVIVNDPTLSIAGGFSSLKFSAGGGSRSITKGINPTSSSFIKPATASNLSAEWDGDTLVISFDFDLSIAQNKYVVGFQYHLTTTSEERSAVINSPDLNKLSNQQTIKFTIADNRKYFGFFIGSFSLLEIQPIDSFGNLGDLATLTDIPSYVVDLCVPEIIANSIPRGYSVDFVESCNKSYDLISIEEVVSTANTAPASGYQQVYLSSIKPATVLTPTTESRWVKARYTSGTGLYGEYSNIVKVTPESLVSADTTGPDNVANVIISSGIDTSGYLGFNAYADISWPAVTGGGIRGYRIRFSNDNGTTYSYVDSPGSGTTYRLVGLAIGSTYQIAVATYDEFNNLSSSFVSGPNVTVTGTPSISNVIAAGPFQLGVGVGGVSTNKGLYFDSSNYWYINAANSARLKVGGTTSNYLEWDGATFAIDGNITARQGTFAGNVSIITGGSLIAGTVGSSSVIVNSNGLSANNSSGSALTEIITSPITFGNTPKGNSTGATQESPLPFPINLFTAGAMIGGWVVGNSVITDRSQQFTLNSTDKLISITGVINETTNYRVRFGTDLSGSGSNTINIFEAGTANTIPNFYITRTGILNAIGAVIDGNITATTMTSTGNFSFAGGILQGTSSSLSLNGGLINIEAIGDVEDDENNFAGDPTLTLNSSNNMVKGRRFIFNGTNNVPINPSTNSGFYTWNNITRTGTFRTNGNQTISVKTGDIIMIY